MALALGLAAAGCGTAQHHAAIYMPVDPLASGFFEQHPSSFGFSGDGNRVVKDIRWSGWGSGRATGRATMLVKGPCEPNCASAAVYSYRVQVVATDLATCSYSNGSKRVYGLVTAYLPQPNAANERSQSLRLQSCQRPS